MKALIRKVKCIYKSSNILASTYVKENNDLTIIFNNGGVYLYKDDQFLKY